jgi:hypothetical protein
MNNLTPSESNLTQSDVTDETELPSTSKPMDRRGILRFGGVAAVAGTAAVVMSAKAAGAATGVMHYGANNGAGADVTSLTSSNSKHTLRVTNSGLGHCIVGDASNRNAAAYGVFGMGSGGAGVAGGTRGDGPGVRAYSEPGARGPALQALTLDANNSSPSIAVLGVGTGHGVYAHISNASNPNQAILGRTDGLGNAVLASVLNAQSQAAAAKAATRGPGPGLEAKSERGVGATFAGKTAQVQLVPSSDAGPPASGEGGQLFVDSAKRLWFCRGGSSWQQLA